MESAVSSQNANSVVVFDHYTRAPKKLFVKGWMAMNTVTTVTKDPVCGMTVDPATALHADRDGKTLYFCGEKCKQTFLAQPAGTKSQDKSGGCCGSGG